MKSFSPSEQSRVSNVLGHYALDQPFLFPFIFIFVSLVLGIPTLGLNQGLVLQRVAHTIRQTKQSKQDIVKSICDIKSFWLNPNFESLSSFSFVFLSFSFEVLLLMFSHLKATTQARRALKTK